MKYKILVDYHTEGWQFSDGEFETIDEAVKSVIGGLGNPFLIVQVVDWEAREVKGFGIM